ncbi:MAG: phosphate transport system substrate-binding protein [Sphingomonadales bacterium]|jgi:phosphate transport system substrate-binding protein|nr:phosphate transport system substrate-binding protein [Sphingomonadales bacterium]
MRAIVLGAALLATPTLVQPAPAAPAPVVRDALAVQRARNAFVAAQMAKHYYEPGRFNLDDLPAYVPETEISGTIRIWASDMWGNQGFQQRLEAAFRRFHPHAHFEYTGISPSGAFAGLLTGLADVAIARRMIWVDLLSFQRRFDRDPIVVAGMTGWAVNPPFVINVHKDNPIASLSLAQLDGIFSAERSGGWTGTTWNPQAARGPEANLRRWGQLGLTGAWAAKPIDVYGYNLQYLFAPRFSDDVLAGSGQWNERLKQFTISATADGKLVSVDQQMASALGQDPQAIAYYSPLRGVDPNTRAVPLRRADGGIVAATIDAVRNHSYPLVDAMWFYANRDADGRTPAKVREFLRFILSREAQQEVNLDTTMLPLTAALVAEQRRKLDDETHHGR